MRSHILYIEVKDSGLPMEPMCQVFPMPIRHRIDGQYCSVEPLDPERHAKDLFEAYTTKRQDADWDYMAYGPFENYEAFREWLNPLALDNDPLFYVVLAGKKMQPQGMLCLMNMAKFHGTIELGHVHFSPEIQRTRVSTEAIFLLMTEAMDRLGYRRMQWQGDKLNERFKKAAERLGFTFEGVSRNHYLVKGQNQDLAWFSIIDSEWPDVKARLEAWLQPGNFDRHGGQKEALR